jgi:hypothetical protein
MQGGTFPVRALRSMPPVDNPKMSIMAHHYEVRLFQDGREQRRAGLVALLRFVIGKSLMMLPLNGLIKAEMPLAGTR